MKLDSNARTPHDKQTVHYRGGRGETFTKVCPAWLVQHTIEALEAEGWIITGVTA